MKRLIMLTLIMALVVGAPFSVLADNSERENASQFCEANDDLGYSNHGRCVRAFMACNGPNNSGPECVCSDFRDNNPKGFYGEYSNMVTCINYLKHGYVFE